MTPEMARRPWAAADPDSEWSGNPDEQKLANLLVSLLNFLDSISVAVQSEAADGAMIQNSVETPLIDWRHRLKPFTDADRPAAAYLRHTPLNGEWFTGGSGYGCSSCRAQRAGPHRQHSCP